MLIEPSPTPTRGALHAQQRGGLAAQPDAKDRGTAQPRPPGGHARTPRVVVDGDGGRWPYPLPCARQRFTFCPATPRLSLSLAVGVRVASTWVDPPRRWREGQGHDGWNREMVWVRLFWSEPKALLMPAFEVAG